MMANTNQKLKSAIFGLAVGDALGVPVEFKSREYLHRKPVTEMIGYGSHNQPPGTWSDDTSLALCTLEAIKDGYDLNRIAENFVKWYRDAYWTARGEIFDIGNTTQEAINNLLAGISPIESGMGDENSNGNGSLMRIIPILFVVKDLTEMERFRIVSEVSSITHAHIRSILGCYIFIEYALEILKGKDKIKAYDDACQNIRNLVLNISIEEELKYFPKVYYGYGSTPITLDDVKSNGYVVNTLDASIRCILTTNNFRDAVLSAVNLGSDSDTTGAVTGALAGLLYGYDSIPKKWIDVLARKDDIERLVDEVKI
jgi:ADP-ribosyl-[dinitrogen reductase] hydrolase